jgi:hypothetical protein
MSLSFVKSAVLSSTDGISHNEEISIDNNETQSLRSGAGGGTGIHKPLFEQLRANRDQQQERDDEFQRSIRGARALDEEDCAHLEAVERMRMEKEHDARSTVEREVELFRAAREDRGLAQTMVGVDDNEEEDDDDNRKSMFDRSRRDETVAKQISNNNKNKFLIDGNTTTIDKKERIQIVPKFTIKKKRKIASSSSSSQELNHRRTLNEKDVVNEKDAVNEKDVVNDTNDNDPHECEAGKGNARSCVTTEALSLSEEKDTNGAQNQSSSDNHERGGILGLGFYGSDSD